MLEAEELKILSLSLDHLLGTFGIDRNCQMAATFNQMNMYKLKTRTYTCLRVSVNVNDDFK
jgi:hypothetical protein